MMERNAVEINQAHRDDLMRTAQAERLKRGVQQQGGARMPVYRPIAAWAGRRFVSLGFRLLILSKEWDARANTVYNGEQQLIRDVTN